MALFYQEPDAVLIDEVYKKEKGLNFLVTLFVTEKFTNPFINQS